MIRDKIDWLAQRELAIRDPGQFHGEIAKREIYWFDSKLTAWIKRVDGPLHWHAINSETAAVADPPKLPDAYLPWLKSFDDSEAPFFRWYKGGLTNACFNEVDASVINGHGDEVAFHFEGEAWDSQLNNGVGGAVDQRSITRKELMWEVAKCALALQKLGLVVGDRIVLNMPNIPEQIFYIEAAKRLGIIFSPLFIGSSPKTIADRIFDLEAKLVVTVSGANIGGRQVKIKESTIDDALENFVSARTFLGDLSEAVHQLEPKLSEDSITRVLNSAADFIGGELSLEKSVVHRFFEESVFKDFELSPEQVALLKNKLVAFLDANSPVPAVLVVRHANVHSTKWVNGRDCWSHEMLARATDVLESKLKRTDAGSAIARLSGREILDAVYSVIKPVAVSADFPLFVMYTSGSTGKPKGIVHTHGGYVAGIAHTMKTCFGVVPGDGQVIYVVADPAWITGQSYMISAALVTRVTSVISEAPPLFPFAGRFARTVEKYKVTILKSGSTFMKAIMADDDAISEIKCADLSSLRVGTFCAEPLSSEVQQFAMETLTPNYINSYWATEHGGIVLTHFFGSKGFRLAANARAYPLPWIVAEVLVDDLDNGNRTAQVGEKGDIVILQPYPYLARTIWGNPVDVLAPNWKGDINRFSETYFSRSISGSDASKSHLLFTQSDFACKYEDGSFSLHGRSDEVIKTSGHRIGTAEIEAAILKDRSQHPGSPIRNAIVVGAPHAERGSVPVAFILSKQKLTNVDISRLTALVRKEKGEIAIPAAFLSVTAFPETRNGKYMRRFLSAMLHGESLGDVTTLKNPECIAELSQIIKEWSLRAAADYSDFSSGTSLDKAAWDKMSDVAREDFCLKIVRQEIAKVLGSKMPDSFGDDMDITAMGIDSLGSALLKSRIKSSTRHLISSSIPNSLTYENRTAKSIAHALVALATSSSHPEDSALPVFLKSERSASYPLSSFQQGVLFSERVKPGNCSYNLTEIFRFNGSIDIGRMQQSLQMLVAQNQMLRTVFHFEGESSRQLISTDTANNFEAVDLRVLPEGVREARAFELARAAADVPYDLSQGPLFRFKLYMLSDQRWLILLAAHHIIFDASSIDLFFAKLSEIYNRHDELEIVAQEENSFFDFVNWQQRFLNSKVADQQLSFWKSRLAGCPSSLNLPFDRAANLDVEPIRSIISLDLPKDLMDLIAKYAHSRSCTVYTLLIAAFKTFVHRISVSDDICVATPVSHRGFDELSDVIGPIVNTIVLRSQYDGSLTFESLLEKVRNELAEAHRFQDAPLENVVQIVKPDRFASRAPLCQVIFNYVSHAELSPFGGGRLQLAWEDMGGGEADLLFHFNQSGSSSELRVKYDTSVFDEATIRRMSANFVTLLENILVSEHQAIASLNIVSKGELATLNAWNRTEQPYSSDKTVHSLFESKVMQIAGSVAVRFENLRWTYVELNHRANEIAHLLMEKGVKSGDYVGICLGRSLDLVASVLGVMKSGAAYIPLDPAYPQDRLEYMLQDSRAKVLLCDDIGKDLAKAASVAVIRLDLVKFAVRSVPLPNPIVEVGSSNVAYVLYTSGSTGKPKGVMVEHGSVINLLQSMALEPGLVSADRLLAVTSLSFDIAGLELYLPLITGAVIILASTRELKDPSLLKPLADSATVMQGTPSTFLMLLEANWLGNPDLKIIVGGEALPGDLVGKLNGKCASLWNVYGPTETTIWSTAKKINFTKPGITIGKPIANTELFVLDKNFQPVPIGVMGELFIGGAGVARGYLNRPELTSEKFIGSTLGKQGPRIYRTGDLVRMLGDGQIEYLSRADNQIKIRGFRIEIGEIESALLDHPAVKTAIVVPKKNLRSGATMLVGCVVMRDPTVTAEALQATLALRLPEFMVPSKMQFLDQWPLTPNGKVDRRAISDLVTDVSEANNVYKPPTTALQIKIAAIWERFLGLDKIGISDDYFSLGGDSIKTVGIQHALCEQSINVELRDIFANRTIEKLSVFLETKQPNQSEKLRFANFSDLKHRMVASLGDRVEDAYPASEMQALMIEKYRGGVYHGYEAIEVTGLHFSLPAFTTAMEQVMTKYPVLRTGFYKDGDKILQLVHRSPKAQLAVVDLRSLGTDDQIRKMSHLKQAGLTSGFNAFEGSSLFRAEVFILDDQPRFVIGWHFHHAIIDGHSKSHFYKSFLQLYQGEPKKSGDERVDHGMKELVSLEQRPASENEFDQLFTDVDVPLVLTSARSQTSIATASPKVREKTFEVNLKAFKDSEIDFKAISLAALCRSLQRASFLKVPGIAVVTNGRTSEMTDPLNAVGLFWKLVPYFFSKSSADVHESAFTVADRLRTLEIKRLKSYRELLRDFSQVEAIEVSYNFVQFPAIAGDSSIRYRTFAEVPFHDQFHFPVNVMVVMNHSGDSARIHFKYVEDMGDTMLEKVCSEFRDEIDSSLSADSASAQSRRQAL